MANNRIVFEEKYNDLSNALSQYYSKFHDCPMDEKYANMNVVSEILKKLIDHKIASYQDYAQKVGKFLKKT